MVSRRLLLLSCCFVSTTVVGCRRDEDKALVGTLEWDRIDVRAEVSEPVVALLVPEGTRVAAGTPILRLDPRRTQAALDASVAEVARLQAALDELVHGTRIEVLEAARADVRRNQSLALHAQEDRKRQAELYSQQAIAKAQMDAADAQLKSSQAALDASRAQLSELLAGTRPESLDRAQASVESARAQERRARLSLERLEVRAPVDGVVDALPFRLGDQPPVGASVVGMLSGPAPYARIWVPERMRASVRPGQVVPVRVDGVETTFQATVRSVRSEPAFTPYYALTGDDAARLSYRAELVLHGEEAMRLPAGLPCHAGPWDAGR